LERISKDAGDFEYLDEIKIKLNTELKSNIGDK